MMAKVELMYRVLVKDKNGKLVKKTRWRKSKSYTIAFLKHIDVFFNHIYNTVGTTVSIIDIGNVARDVRAWTTIDGASGKYMTVLSPDNSSSYGIQVGSGVTAPTNVDYALETQIAHGVGAGQLDYGAHSRTAAGVVGANVDFIISRAFYNGSGGNVGVNEIGMACATAEYNTWTARYFLLIRDVLPSTVTVADTQTLTVQYTLRTTV